MRFWAYRATFKGDCSRRALQIYLDAKTERPDERTDFVHKDIIPHVIENRPTYVRAALTIALAFIRAGSPQQPSEHLGGFEEWCRVVQQPVIWAGSYDPVVTNRRLREQADPMVQNRTHLLEALHSWWKERGEQEGFTVADLKTGLTDETELARAVIASLDALGFSMPFDGHRLGRYLGKTAGRIHAGLRLIKGTRKTSGATWSIEVTRPEPQNTCQKD
jgi:hypothetical protein